MAVVITRNSAGADVGLAADPGVADIGQMIGLGAVFEGSVFDLDEIADPGLGADFGAGPEPGEGADYRARRNARPFDVAKGFYLDVVGHRHPGAEKDVGTDAHVAA